MLRFQPMSREFVSTGWAKLFLHFTNNIFIDSLKVQIWFQYLWWCQGYANDRKHQWKLHRSFLAEKFEIKPSKYHSFHQLSQNLSVFFIFFWFFWAQDLIQWWWFLILDKNSIPGVDVIRKPSIRNSKDMGGTCNQLYLTPHNSCALTTLMGRTWQH